MLRNQHPEDVKASVRKTGITLSGLARRHGISTSAVRKSLYLPVPSGNRAIAEHLKKSLHVLWPEWYDANGNRKPNSVTWPKRRKHTKVNMRRGWQK